MSLMSGDVNQRPYICYGLCGLTKIRSMSRTTRTPAVSPPRKGSSGKVHDANNCCIVHGEAIHNASYHRRHRTRSRLDPYFVLERSFGKDESMADFQNLISANESQISVHLPSLNSPLKSSFNNPYTKNLCKYPHADYDPLW